MVPILHTGARVYCMPELVADHQADHFGLNGVVLYNLDLDQMYQSCGDIHISMSKDSSNH